MDPLRHVALISLGFILILFSTLPLSAQGRSMSMRTVDSMRRMPTFAQASASRGHTQITFDWAAAAAAPGTVARRGRLPELHQFQMRNSRPVSAPPVRERHPQIGIDDIVVVALDAQGVEVSWQRVKDPRILRAEMPDANGLLSGQTLYRTDTELVVTVPDDVDAAFLDVYEPVANGPAVDLRPLARVALR